MNYCSNSNAKTTQYFSSLISMSFLSILPLRYISYLYWKTHGSPSQTINRRCEPHNNAKRRCWLIASSLYTSKKVYIYIFEFKEDNNRESLNLRLAVALFFYHFLSLTHIPSKLISKFHIYTSTVKESSTIEFEM